MTIQSELFNEAESGMKDTRFMTAAQKGKILQQWNLFLKSRLAADKFTEPLYNHLILHCSFIAHFNRKGFYLTYFEEPEDSIRFLRQFDNRNGIPQSIRYTPSDYHDINTAMCNVASRYIPDLIKELQVRQKDMDVLRAKALLAKHGLKTLEG